MWCDGLGTALSASTLSLRPGAPIWSQSKHLGVEWNIIMGLVLHSSPKIALLCAMCEFDVSLLYLVSISPDVHTKHVRAETQRFSTDNFPARYNILAKWSYNVLHWHDDIKPPSPKFLNTLNPLFLSVFHFLFLFLFLDCCVQSNEGPGAKGKT